MGCTRFVEMVKEESIWFEAAPASSEQHRDKDACRNGYQATSDMRVPV